MRASHSSICLHEFFDVKLHKCHLPYPLFARFRPLGLRTVPSYENKVERQTRRFETIEEVQKESQTAFPVVTVSVCEEIN